MTVSVATHSLYVIEGDQISDSDRAFLRAATVYIIDGAEAGSTSERAFLRSTAVRIIDGPPPADFPGMRALSHAIFSIDGRLGTSGVFLKTGGAIYSITGTINTTREMVALKHHTLYSVDTE